MTRSTLSLGTTGSTEIKTYLPTCNAGQLDNFAGQLKIAGHALEFTSMFVSPTHEADSALSLTIDLTITVIRNENLGILPLFTVISHKRNDFLHAQCLLV